MPREQNRTDEQQEEPGKGITELIDSTVTSSYEDLLAIIEARMELIKIEITEKLAMVAALVIIAILFIAGLVYLITTIALFIGELLGHYYLGYLIVSSVFLFTFLLFAKIRPELLKNVIHNILLSSHGKKS
ncbi:MULTISPECIES: phage holin family protein [unclassified Prosthecochloris]|uniref:phage holin family protein n=1 Tax=unclassified Prosthecochloris TaxID=2632826 RepID=UPI00223DAF1C|nr:MULTISPECIES: phage holin family protein [unclassified Prosthecochloris]UZJ39016.1 phage holin family protein [Prosthecochloris sp. SCSIO W1102]